MTDRSMLVTGATGLLGSHVAEAAIAQGWRVKALVRPPSRPKLAAIAGHERLEVVEGDLIDPTAVGRGLDGARVVVHCAAKVGDWGPHEEYQRVNVDGLRVLLRAATASRLDRFIHISTVSVYPARDQHGTDESSALADTAPDGYSRSKIDAEKLIRQSVDEQRLPAVILRPGLLYGPRDGTVMPELLEGLRRGRVAYVGTGQHLQANTFVGNLVDAIFLCLTDTSCVGRTFNITDDPLVTNQQYLQTVARLAGYPPPRHHVPRPIVWLAACLVEDAARLLGARHAPIVSRGRYRVFGLNRGFTISRARHELGYQPRWTFEDGMRLTIEWFKHTGQLVPPRGTPTPTS